MIFCYDHQIDRILILFFYLSDIYPVLIFYLSDIDVNLV